MDNLGLVVVILILGGAASLAVFLVRQERKRAAARAALASLRGWRYGAGGGRGMLYHVEGEECGAWRVECWRGGKNSPGRTAFTCGGASTGGGVVHVGAAGMAAMLKTPMARTVTGWAMRLGGSLGMSTGPLERLMEHFVEVEPGGPAFAERFSVLATDEALARRLVTARSCEILLAYAPAAPGGRFTARALFVTWSEEGMLLSLGREASAPEAMASFAELGIALAKESRDTGW